MKKLIDRLRPEYLIKLDEVKDKHPYTYNAMVLDLTSHYVYGDLTVGSAMSLCTFLTNNSENLYSLNSEIFKPFEIK